MSRMHVICKKCNQKVYLNRGINDKSKYTQRISFRCDHCHVTYNRTLMHFKATPSIQFTDYGNYVRNTMLKVKEQAIKELETYTEYNPLKTDDLYLPNALNSFSSEIEKAINRAIFDVMTDETTYQLLRTVFWAAIQSENPVYIKHVQENSKESEMLLDVGSNRKIEFNKPFLIEDTNSELDFDSNKDRADKGKKHKTKKTPNKVLIG